MRNIQQNQERRRAIMVALQKSGFVHTSHLSAQLGVSEVSIRKDLEFLEHRGLLKRIHGGAQLVDDALSLLDFSERYLAQRTSKQRIARRALAFLNTPGLCVYLDTGTTNLILARAMPADLPVMVVTNSFTTIGALEGHSACEVITLGGAVDYQRKIFSGPWANAQLERFSFDLLFAGADGITGDGFGCDDPVQSELLRKAISRARTAYVLADSSKAGKRSRSIYAKPGEVTAWITDGNLGPAFVPSIETQGGKVIIAE